MKFFHLNFLNFIQVYDHLNLEINLSHFMQILTDSNNFEIPFNHKATDFHYYLPVISLVKIFHFIFILFPNTHYCQSYYFDLFINPKFKDFNFTIFDHSNFLLFDIMMR